MDTAIEKLANLLDKDPYQINQLLSDRSTSRYLKLAENLDSDTVATPSQNSTCPASG